MNRSAELQLGAVRRLARASPGNHHTGGTPGGTPVPLGPFPALARSLPSK